MTTLPSLYISHGSPMTALQPGLTGKRLAELAAVLPRPKAIVMASAHWLSRRPQVGSAAMPETIHDFGGFPAALYQLHYPAPGDPVLADRVMQLLDHGAWVPLRLLYPAADIPVVPVSIQPELGSAQAVHRLDRAEARRRRYRRIARLSSPGTVCRTCASHRRAPAAAVRGAGCRRCESPSATDRRGHRHGPAGDGYLPLRRRDLRPLVRPAHCTMIVPTIIGWIEQ